MRDLSKRSLKHIKLGFEEMIRILIKQVMKYERLIQAQEDRPHIPHSKSPIHIFVAIDLVSLI